MLESVLPFSPDLTEKVSEYCEKHAEGIAQLNTVQYGDSAKRRHAIHLALPTLLHKHWEWDNPSLRSCHPGCRANGWFGWLNGMQQNEVCASQGTLAVRVASANHQLMILATKYSSLELSQAFPPSCGTKGTRNSKAGIVSFDIPSEVFEITSNLFAEVGVADRITLVEGAAAKTSMQPSKDLFGIGYLQHGFFRLRTIEGESDLILSDPDKQNNKLYLDLVLEPRLLSPKGVILVDNGRGGSLAAPNHLLTNQ
ncbi:MAG: hypothetical protein Q9197_003974 [Variospora fuerteventurae]